MNRQSRVGSGDQAHSGTAHPASLVQVVRKHSPPPVERGLVLSRPIFASLERPDHVVPDRERRRDRRPGLGDRLGHLGVELLAAGGVDDEVGVLDLVGTRCEHVTGGLCAQGVDAYAPSEPVGLQNGRPELLRGVRGTPRHRPDRTASRRHDLDVVHARLEDPPDHGSHPLRTIGFATEVPAVAAGDRDRATAQVEPGDGDVPESLGTPEIQRRLPHPSAVPECRDARAKRPPGVLGGEEGEDAVRLLHRALKRGAVSGQDQMDMRVDQPGQQRVPGQVQDRRIGGPLALGVSSSVYLVDPAVAGDDRGIADRRRAGAVDQPGRANNLPCG